MRRFRWPLGMFVLAIAVSLFMARVIDWWPAMLMTCLLLGMIVGDVGYHLRHRHDDAL